MKRFLLISLLSAIALLALCILGLLYVMLTLSTSVQDWLLGCFGFVISSVWLLLVFVPSIRRISKPPENSMLPSIWTMAKRQNGTS